jgi:hypothetical protein
MERLRKERKGRWGEGWKSEEGGGWKSEEGGGWKSDDQTRV